MPRRPSGGLARTRPVLLVQLVASARMRAPGRHGERRGPARLRALRGRKRGGWARGRGASDGAGGYCYIVAPLSRALFRGAEVASSSSRLSRSAD
eukprot:3940723-Pyramimonas_sp.AAC.1